MKVYSVECRIDGINGSDTNLWANPNKAFRYAIQTAVDSFNNANFYDIEYSKDGLDVTVFDRYSGQVRAEYWVSEHNVIE